MTQGIRSARHRRTGLGTCVLAVVLLFSASHAHGQKPTEQYIPIGMSPGVSGKYTSLGAISGANARSRVITFADAAGPKTVQVTDTTRIWLDRSKLKLTNVSGRFTDLVKGRRVEVKYQVGNPRFAEWVKVEITQP